ncbi:amidohydrolase family protein [Vulcanisaeta thermophila]|uniref:amidohydrolase family protein n=1 Tax=Vulcanisaeta thermophila TaxID=867917 RepID=UPI000852BE66|nr:amidohydrolase family protein [Vulcanisaeta thermophila]
MFIDFHVCPSTDLGLLKSKLTRLGALKAVLQPIDVDPSFQFALNNALGEVGIGGKDLLVWYRFSRELISLWNERMYDNTKLVSDVSSGEYGDFFISMGSVDPALGARYVVSKLNEIDKLKLPGIVVSPVLQFFDPLKNRAFRYVLNYVEKTNKLLILHLDPCPRNAPLCINASAPSIVSEIMDRYNITLVVSALGISDDMFLTWLRDMARVMKRHDRVYLETSGINCNLINTPMGRGLIRNIGIERFLFGSGYPYVRYRGVIRELNCIMSGLSKEALDYLMYYNAMELLRQVNGNYGDLAFDFKASYD